MTEKFDQLAKGLAQSTTRRQALKRFGLGLAAAVLACFGLANKAEAGHGGCKGSGAVCHRNSECCSGFCELGFGKYKHKRKGRCA